MTQIIGLHGPIGSGKTTVAQAMRESLVEANIISFNNPMKNMLFTLLMVSGKYTSDEVTHLLYTQDGKKTELDILQGKTVRHALQTLGTQWGRDCIGHNFWTDLVIAKAMLSDAPYIIIDDVRFESERLAIEENGGTVLGLDRPDVKYDTSHVSEARLGRLQWVANNDTPEHVAKKIIDIFLTQ